MKVVVDFNFYFSNLKNDFPSDVQVEHRQKEIINHKFTNFFSPFKVDCIKRFIFKLNFN